MVNFKADPSHPLVFDMIYFYFQVKIYKFLCFYLRVHLQYIFINEEQQPTFFDLPNLVPKVPRQMQILVS